MASSSIDLSSVDSTTPQPTVVRADARVALAELNRLAVLAQDPSQDVTAAAQSAATSASQVMSELSGVLSNVQSQVQSGGAPTAALRQVFDSANDQLSRLQAAVGKVNNALFAAGSPVRLQSSSSGVQVSNVNSQAAVSGNPFSSSSTPSSQWSDGLTSDPEGPSTSGLSQFTQPGQSVDPSVKNSPIWNLLVTAIKDVVSAMVAQQNGQTSATGTPSATASTLGASSTATASTATAATQPSTSQPSTSSASASAPTSSTAPTSTAPASPQAAAYSDGSGGGGSGEATSPNASTAGEPGSTTAGEGAGAQVGEGSPLMQMFLKALQNAAGQQSNGQGQSTGGAGGKGKAAVATGHAGTTNQAFSGNAQTPANTQGVNNPGSDTVQANDDVPIGNGAGNSVPDTAGAGGDPMIGQANINGLLMMVLLECYQDGQKDLESLATRLQDINNSKKGLRNELDGLRSGGNGNSTQVQNLEDQLNSMGDDAQMEQLDLQNMAQNQQQLLQMISDFSKNTNTNSMAIIRNIAG